MTLEEKRERFDALCMIEEFNRLIREKTAIKQMLDDWTARQTEAEGEDGNA